MKNALVDGLLQQAKTLKRLIYRGVYHASGAAKTDAETVERFHQLYYDSAIFGATWNQTSWLGTPVLKCQTDLWLYQEMLFELKPDLIIETGSAAGGSAHYMASILELLGKGKVVTIDIEKRERPAHPRITYLTGSSTDPALVNVVKSMIRPNDQVLVTLDSDHSKTHVLNELRTYHSLVPKGSYLIVEDSNVNGHPVAKDFGPGPMEALEEFLKENTQFEVDKTKEKFLLTFNPKGYLKRVG